MNIYDYHVINACYQGWLKIIKYLILKNFDIADCHNAAHDAKTI